MMSERTELIKARREAEDNLVKTIIQLASGLIVLLSGFSVQSRASLIGLSYWTFVLATIALAVAVSAGLTEQYFSSKAYLAQQDLVEKYFTKQISIFSEPAENVSVRRAQVVAFSSFLVSLALLGSIAIANAGVPDVEQSSSTSSTSSTSSASSASSAAPAAVSSRELRR